MNCHIEAREHGYLWLNDPRAGVGLYAPPGFPWLKSAKLIEMLRMSDCKRDGGYRSRAIKPERFAAMIAKELCEEVQHLPHYSNPPTIKMADELAEDLKIPSETMTVEEFIRRFSAEE